MKREGREKEERRKREGREKEVRGKRQKKKETLPTNTFSSCGVEVTLSLVAS